MAANNVSTRVRAVEQNRRVMLGGIVGLLMLLQAGAGLFALWYSHASAAQSRAQLGMIADALDTVRSAQASFGVQVQEWKNILLRDRDPVLSRHHRASFQAAGTEVQTALGRRDTVNVKISAYTFAKSEAMRGGNRTHARTTDV